MPGRGSILKVLLCAMIGACPLICADNEAGTVGDGADAVVGAVDPGLAPAHHHDHPPAECPACPGNHTCVCQSGIPQRAAVSAAACDVLPLIARAGDITPAHHPAETLDGPDQPPERQPSRYGRNLPLLI